MVCSSSHQAWSIVNVGFRDKGFGATFLSGVTVHFSGSGSQQVILLLFDLLKIHVSLGLVCEVFCVHIFLFSLCKLFVSLTFE